MRAFLSATLVALSGLPSTASALTLQRGDIVIALYSDETVIRVNPGSGVADVLSPATPLDDIQDIAFEPGGDLVCIANNSGAEVIRIDTATGARSLLASGGALAASLGYSITTTPEGAIFILTFDFTTATISKVGAVNGAVSPVSTGVLLAGATSLVYEPSTGALLTAGSGRVVRVSTLSGAQALVGENAAIDITYDMSVAHDGGILLAIDRPYILRFDPTTGQSSQFIQPPAQDAATTVAVVVEPSGAILVGALVSLQNQTVLRFLSGGGTDSMRAFTSEIGQFFNGQVAVYNPAPCPSDIDGSGVVDFADLNRVLSDYGEPCP